MQGLFEQLRSIVDVEDGDSVPNKAIEAEVDNLPNDVNELKSRLTDALRRVETASEQWKELCSESCAIESELAALRLRYNTSREQWQLVHQFDQETIDALLEERLAARAGDPDAPDATFIASLRSQNATMRALIQKYGEARDRARLDGHPPPPEPVPVAEPAAGVAALEAELSRQARALAALARERREAPGHAAAAPEAPEAPMAPEAPAEPAAELPSASASAADEAQLAAAREEALHALYRDVQLLRARNAELDAQLAGAGEQAAQLAAEAAAAREECLAERRRAEEWRDAAERAHQERQRAGRELAAAGDELRRARWLAEMRSAPQVEVQMQAPPPPPPPGPGAAQTAQAVGAKAQFALRDWRRVLGRRSRALVATAAFVAFVTLFFTMTGGGAAEHEMVALRLQEELRLCRMKLMTGGAAAAAAPRA